MNTKRDSLIQKEFSKWVRDYGKVRPPGIRMKKDLTKTHLENQMWAISKLKPKRGHKIIDIACGLGKALVILSDKVGNIGEVVGIDITKEMIQESRKRTKKLENVSLRVAGVNNIPFKDNYFDGAMSTNAFHHFYEPVKMLGEIRRVVKTGGKVVIVDSNGATKTNKRYDRILKRKEKAHYKFFTYSEMKKIFREAGITKVKGFRKNGKFLLIGKK